MTPDQLKAVAALLDRLLDAEMDTGLAIQGRVEIVESDVVIARVELYANSKPEVSHP